MLKLFFCLLVIACGGGVGLQISRRYSARVRQLSKCDQLLSRLQSLLTVERLTTRELFERAAESGSLAELSFLSRTARGLARNVNFPAVWRESLQASRAELALAKEDYPPLEALAEVIGAYDAGSQAEALELSRELLRENARQAQEQSAKNGKLSSSLGLLCGIAIAILLV